MGPGSRSLCSFARDDENYSRGAISPELLHQRVPRKSRAQGKPGASCTRSLACKIDKKHTSVVTPGSARSTRLSPRNGLTAYFVLPGERILCCHRRRRDTSRKLGTNNGCQDHTTWPYVLAFSPGAMKRSHLTPKRPSHPAPNVFVTIAKRPSGGHETAELVEMICPTAKAKYFSLMVWTDFW